MMRALNTAGTGMVSQQMNLDVIANNLANVNTTGFKGQRAEFQDLVYQMYRPSGGPTGGGARLPQAAQIGLGSKYVNSSTNFSQGSMNSTNNPLDMAISGDGFFQVELPNGETAYTRDGTFKVDADGQVVNADGYKIKPNITLPTGYRALSIAPTGEVTAITPGNNDPTSVGEIKLVLFPNPGGLTRQ
ncbi:MAG: flagellar hook-basal body complex protein, partial [Armatimonadota bacterium]